MPFNPIPAMTSILVKAGAFSREPFTLVDIGARGGIKDYAQVFGEDLRVIGFEPDPDEFLHLQRLAIPRMTILPFGLGGCNETRTLYIHRNASSSSLYVEDPVFVQRMLFREWYVTINQQPIELRRLDDLAAVIGDVDFIDLDAEGAEFEIMQAGTAVLGHPETLGVYLEVRFLEGLNTPVFWQSDQFVRSLGYSLYDLAYAREGRVALPYPMCVDQRDEKDSNLRIFGPTVGGQLAHGDALYLRDAVGAKTIISVTKVLKLACLFEIFHQNDSAAELILAHKARIDEIYDHRELLDALVPVVGGKKLSYNEYIRRYFAHDPMFRPQISLSIKLRNKLVLWKRYLALLADDPSQFWTRLRRRVGLGVRSN